MAVTESRDAQLTQVLVEFAEALGTDFSVRRMLDHLAQRIKDLLPVTGAGVVIVEEGDQLRFISATDDVITSIEAIQNELREGPCWRAYETGHAVGVPDLSVDAEFAEFSARALQEGMAAVFTFPMRLAGGRLGAIDLYRDAPGDLDAWQQRAGQVLADVAAAYLYNAQSRMDLSAALARVHHASLHDPLTGLANRVLFKEQLDQAVARARRSGAAATVLYLDLDRFKSVNDNYGHHVGDQLLAAVAARVQGALRPGDCLARLGGDEFAALCEDLTAASDAELIASRIVAVMTEPFEIADLTLQVTASVGVAFCGPGQDIPPQLLREADLAMYEAKSGGGGRHAVLAPAAQLAANRRRDLENDLSQAQARDELVLHYQPIIDLTSGATTAVEALLRWQHPTRGEVLPAGIVPVAERTGMILPLGAWVLGQACRDAAHWQARDPDRQVTVNVSAHQVMGVGFLPTLERVLAETGLDPAALVLEVTESVLLTDGRRALEVLREVKRLGLRLSLDDFGTGYSSLAYLRQYPFDVVKVDRSFTADVLHDSATRSIVRAMTDLGHVLDLSVTAEGVETVDELEAVRELGADHAQGFYLGHPAPAVSLDDPAARLASR